MKRSENQQKDISDQPNQRNVELAALGTEKRNLTEKVEKLQEQVELLDDDRGRRESLEKQLQETLEAQKKVNIGQSDVIVAQKSELKRRSRNNLRIHVKTRRLAKGRQPCKR